MILPARAMLSKRKVFLRALDGQGQRFLHLNLLEWSQSVRMYLAKTWSSNHLILWTFTRGTHHWLKCSILCFGDNSFSRGWMHKCWPDTNTTRSCWHNASELQGSTGSGPRYTRWYLKKLDWKYEVFAFSEAGMELWSHNMRVCSAHLSFARVVMETYLRTFDCRWPIGIQENKHIASVFRSSDRSVRIYRCPPHIDLHYRRWLNREIQ